MNTHILSIYFHTYLLTSHSLTYLLTPWCRVLLEKLTGLQLVKKFPAFHGTRRLITALTSVRQLSLSWASPIQSTYQHPTSWRSILILSTHLRLGLPSGLFPSYKLLMVRCLYEQNLYYQCERQTTKLLNVGFFFNFEKFLASCPTTQPE